MDPHLAVEGKYYEISCFCNVSVKFPPFSLPCFELRSIVKTVNKYKGSGFLFCTILT